MGKLSHCLFKTLIFRISQALSSTTPDASTFVIHGSSANGISSSAVQNALLSASPVFTVYLDNGLAVPIYNSSADAVQPSPALLSVIEAVIQNRALFASLPFNVSAQADFTSSVATFISGLDLDASEVLGVQTFRQAGSSLRRATPDAVVLGITVNQASPLVTGLNVNLMAGLSYNGTPSTFLYGSGLTRE